MRPDAAKGQHNLTDKARNGIGRHCGLPKRTFSKPRPQAAPSDNYPRAPLDRPGHDQSGHGRRSRAGRTHEAAEAPDIAGFPMMGTGGAARPQEEERNRHAWHSQDGDIRGLPVDLVPPAI